MKILFWVSAFIIFYVYIGYPLAVYILSLCCKIPVKKEYIYPKTSILVAAYNEENYIQNKIESILDCDYPKDKIEILIGSDGSDDATDGLVLMYKDRGVQLVRQDTRKGKPGMLNRLASMAKGEILVFSDARQKLAKSSIKELVSNFNDKTIGSVSSELIFEREDTKPGRGIGLYWVYEKFIRKSESEIGSMMGATGAMYAVRKKLFSRIPEDLILDDIYIPLNTVRKGYRAIFEPKAKIYDRIVDNSRQEFTRKARTLAGNFQLFKYLKWAFDPIQSAISWQLVSHKFMRLFVPYFLAILFISNTFIVDNYFYSLVFFMQAGFYILAVIGGLVNTRGRMLGVPLMFCVMNMAAVAGFFNYITGKQSVRWERQNA